MKDKKRFSQLNIVSSNRGAALISIIIVMTVVSTLGFLSLSVSYRNFRMKNVDQMASANFYEAENIVEEICVELQEEVSKIYEQAYREVLASYNTYDTSDELQTAYEDRFYELLTEKFADTTRSGHYKFDEIKGLLTDLDGRTKVEVALATEGADYFDKGVGGMFLRNVQVTYSDEGYHDTITTDIKISAPSIALEKLDTIPSSMTEYILSADGGMEVLAKTDSTIETEGSKESTSAGTTGSQQIAINSSTKDNKVTNTGRIYLGLLETENNANLIARQGELLSLWIPDEATFNIEKADGGQENIEIVTEGGILVEKGSTFSLGEGVTLWTESLTLDGITDEYGVRGAYNEVSLLGKTYVKDDTTINGKGNSLTLGGEYYGYSGSARNAADSSAIIINGTETELSMAALKRLVISGTSFVGTAGEAGNGYVSQEDVFMGDSIAVKSNQLIYLVPTECEGIKSNPMSYQQYDALVANAGWENSALNTYVRGLGRTIASYGNVRITPVFTQKFGGAVYLYLQFSSQEAAADYFMDCYGITENGERVARYLNNYVTAFTAMVDSSAKLHTAGNYLVQEGLGTTYKAAAGGVKDMPLGDAYETLCEEGQFESLIDEYELRKFVGGTGGTFTKTIAESEDVIGRNAEEITIVVVDNASTNEVYKIDNDFRGVLIATGDVEIMGGTKETMTIEGSIICGGKLSVTGLGMNLAANQAVTAQALKIEKEDAFGASAMNMLVGNHGVPTSEEEESEVVDIRNCITFENWKAE